jgi:hypothetical protein
MHNVEFSLSVACWKHKLEIVDSTDNLHLLPCKVQKVVILGVLREIQYSYIGQLGFFLNFFFRDVKINVFQKFSVTNWFRN